ncbi:MAG TPA: hypothetical protein VH120_00400 [Gemmataceae bacterium]|jgi:hypothetical protein|nr:hypothetical protein [Gemmataceae bacterium]
MPPLDRAAALVVSFLLPACLLNRSTELSHGPAGPVMPTIQLAKGGQSDEPPLAPITVAARPMGEASGLAILPVRAESPVGAADRAMPAHFEEPTGGRNAEPPEPKRADSPLLAALKCYLNKSPEQAAQCLESMDPADRDLLTALLPLAVRLGDGALKSADPQDLAAVVADVQALVGPLRERAALEVPKLCFCRPKATPAQFGRYEQIEENHRFRPGEVVGLYVEVRNIICAPNGADYRTQVAMSMEVHNEQGETVWRSDPPARPDRSLSPRQDYCHVGWFKVPSDLPAGAFTLSLKVTDVPTGRTARRSLDFRVTTVKDVRSGGTSE